MPTIADGSVFVTGLRGHTLYAFPVTCGSGDSLCEPSWTAPIGAWSSSQPPLTVTDAGGSRVYVGTKSGVLAFDADCADGAGPCPRAVSVGTNEPVRALAYADDLLYVGTGRPGEPYPHNVGAVIVYSVSCLQAHPSANDGCIRWSRPVGQVWDLATDPSTLYVGVNGGSKALQAYAISCIRSGQRCRALWTGETDCCTQLTVADGVVYADDQTQHVFAFSASCPTSDAGCQPRWTSRGVLGMPYVDFERPIVAGDLVFVGGDEGWIYAFDRSCSGTCAPSSRIFIADQNGIPGIWDARVSGDRLYVAGEDGLHVFAPGSPRAVEVPSAGEAPVFYLALAFVGGTLLALGVRRRRRLQL
jgi:outer membrane protein assembly factor BamB